MFKDTYLLLANENKGCRFTPSNLSRLYKRIAKTSSRGIEIFKGVELGENDNINDEATIFVITQGRDGQSGVTMVASTNGPTYEKNGQKLIDLNVHLCSTVNSVPLLTLAQIERIMSRVQWKDGCLAAKVSGVACHLLLKMFINFWVDNFEFLRTPFMLRTQALFEETDVAETKEKVQVPTPESPLIEFLTPHPFTNVLNISASIDQFLKMTNRHVCGLCGVNYDFIYKGTRQPPMLFVAHKVVCQPTSLGIKGAERHNEILGVCQNCSSLLSTGTIDELRNKIRMVSNTTSNAVEVRMPLFVNKIPC